MTTCLECGHTGGPGAKFCTHCGAAVPPQHGQATETRTVPVVPARPEPARPASVSRDGSKVGLIGLVVACVATVGVIATFALVDANSGGSAESPAGSPPDGPITHRTSENLVPPSPTAVYDDASALAELERLRNEDRPEVEALVGQWVPQLSGKRPGLVAHGITYYHIDILRDFHDNQSRYPDALLLFSGDYTSFRHGDFWITVVPRPQLDGPGANAWCDAQGIPVDDCYAKMISHTVAYSDATEIRQR
jgi:hypothetical protein